jgi:uncharacterized protein YjbJ (UPF0337 family)
MNWTRIEGKWEQLKGEAKSKWGKLTDDDLKAIRGKFDSLVGKVIERYGVGREQARDQVMVWADRLHERVDALGRDSNRKEPSNQAATTSPKRN